MTTQLSKATLEALKVELARYGLVVRPAPKSRKATSIEAWKPKTSDGKRTRKKMLFWAAHPIVGASNYMVKGEDGAWHTESSDGFQAAKAYQKRQYADFFSTYTSSAERGMIAG